MKQVIVIRKDLYMRRGKEIAQGAHASQLSLAACYSTVPSVGQCEISPPRGVVVDLQLWFGHWAVRKITCQVGSEAELLAVFEAAKKAGLPCALVRDEGLTEFASGNVATAVGVGPASDEDVAPVTGALKLY